MSLNKKLKEPANPDLEHQSASSVDTQAKALTVNMDGSIYGTFAEIGAGQEIGAWFFKVGGAAGTVAKTMSAYDMTVSDDIYGKANRYVSEARLNAMLSHEYTLLNERLSEKSGSEKRFFVLADTVSARNYSGTNECHGWIGIRHQENPLEEPIDITLHVNLLDDNNFLQQEALGILGVNLIYGAYFIQNNLDAFLRSLLDDLGSDRIEIDSINFKGGSFDSVDEVNIGLSLVYTGLACSVMLSKDRKLIQPSSIIRKRKILVERGAYRIVRDLGNTAIEKARTLISQEKSAKPIDEILINELSIKSVHQSEEVPKEEMHSLVLAVLESCEQYAMISSFTWYYDISQYLRRYSKEPIGFVMGISTMTKLFNEEFYDESSGSLLEVLGKLLAIGAKVYVYPMSTEIMESSINEFEGSKWHYPENQIITLDNLYPLGPAKHLFQYLKESNYLVGV